MVFHSALSLQIPLSPQKHSVPRTAWVPWTVDHGEGVILWPTALEDNTAKWSIPFRSLGTYYDTNSVIENCAWKFSAVQWNPYSSILAPSLAWTSLSISKWIVQISVWPLYSDLDFNPASIGSSTCTCGTEFLIACKVPKTNNSTLCLTMSVQRLRVQEMVNNLELTPTNVWTWQDCTTNF